MAPPSRPYWKGYLRLALVQIAVQIHNATEASKTSLNQIHKPSGKRINYTITAGGEEVDRNDVVKAYPVAEDTYITLEPEELDAIKLETKKTLDLREFVKIEDIDPRYFERPYYIVPEDEFATEGYMVIQAALKQQNRLGIGQIVMGGREYLGAVGAIDNGLAMYVLRYPNELRAADKYFADVPETKPTAEMVDLALELIRQNSSAFKPDAYSNSYEVALLDLVKRKSKGKKVVTAEPEEGKSTGRGNVVDLMEALRKSVTSKGSAGDKARPPAKKRRKGAG